VLIPEDGFQILLRDDAVPQEEYSQRGPRVWRSFHRPELSAPPSPGFTQDQNPRVRAVLQRVREASVSVDGKLVAACGPGVLVLLGIAVGDGREEAERLAGKIARLRIFEDRDGRFDRSLLDIGGEALVVSQFTLLADTRKGNRPSFTDAAPPDVAQPLYECFAVALGDLGVPVQTGVFGARMEIALVNDGPVTIVLDVA
jgi:D-tyrosyl-tRNA(Tyr) deacylase